MQGQLKYSQTANARFAFFTAGLLRAALSAAGSSSRKTMRSVIEKWFHGGELGESSLAPRSVSRLQLDMLDTITK